MGIPYIDSSIYSGLCRSKRPGNASSLRQCCPDATDILAAWCCPVSCNRPD